MSAFGMFRSPAFQLARALGAGLLLASCVTVHSQHEATADIELAAARPVAVWEIVSGEKRLGFVVRYDESGETSRSFFSVRNGWHQELGLIVELGRFWRLLPLEVVAWWLGSGTVEQGVQRILELDEQACLREVELKTAGQDLAMARAVNAD